MISYYYYISISSILLSVSIAFFPSIKFLELSKKAFLMTSTYLRVQFPFFFILAVSPRLAIF